MRTVLLTFIVVVVVAAISLNIRRQADNRVDRAEMHRLLATLPSDPSQFTAEMVIGPAEPARRYFSYAITEGTPLFNVA